ncbi:MAG: uracil-DNA glycosylase [Azospirillum sp.]|nr:uracil-DNA glycosylase [Azospirillum sp.]
MIDDLPWVDYQRPKRETAGRLLALVGEAPGSEEVRQGFPFAGRSGRLLDRTLVAAGIDRDACLVANVFRLQPPGNKVGHFFASRTRARRDGLELAERLGRFGGSDLCLARYAGEIDALSRILNDLRPAVIVALGRTPLWALTGQAGILQCRGEILECRLVAGAEVVPTFHPSYLLRGRHEAEGIFLGDLTLAARRLSEAARRA